MVTFAEVEGMSKLNDKKPRRIRNVKVGSPTLLMTHRTASFCTTYLQLLLCMGNSATLCEANSVAFSLSKLVHKPRLTQSFLHCPTADIADLGASPHI